MILRKDKQKKITPKDLKKRKIQKRIDKIEDSEGFKSKENKSKSDKRGKENRERIEEEKRSKKPHPMINLIEDIIKTPYYIRGGMGKKESKGGRANLRGGGMSQRGLGKAFKNGGRS